MTRWSIGLALLSVLTGPATLAGQQPGLDVRVVTDEADAVLALVAELTAGRAPADSLWRRLFASDGYRRRVARERSIGRPFADSAFEAFVRSPDLALRAPALRETLARWASADPAAAARAAFAYLPAGARILNVADAFDAMTSDRPYRRALTLESALTELRRGAGTQFDAEVVGCLTRLHDQGHFSLLPSPSSEDLLLLRIKPLRARSS